MKKGFKGFKKGLICREMQFAENTEFETTGTPVLCKNGLHFCENPLSVFEYYPPEIGAEYATVEATGATETDQTKTVTNKLKIHTKISLGNMFKFHFDLIFDSVKQLITDIKASPETVNTAGEQAHANTAGEQAHANTAGYKAHANTAGNYAHANTAGEQAHANTAGEQAHANTAGYKAHANTAGNYAHANTAGEQAHANTAGEQAHANTAGYKAHANTAGNYAHANTAGEQAIACALGIESKASAKKGWIIITEWRHKNGIYVIKNIHTCATGKKLKGVLIEPTKKYWFEGGELKSELL